MRAFRTALLLTLPALALLAACGGDDDSDDGGGGDSPNGTPGTSATRSAGGSANIPAIKDGSFENGTASLQVSGGEDLKIEAKGNGIAQGGFALLTFADDDATVILTFQGDSKEEPGGLAITTKKLTTAGEWGKDCTVTIEDSARELKGEFSCKDIDAVDGTSTRAYKLRVTGKFSVPR